MEHVVSLRRRSDLDLHLEVVGLGALTLEVRARAEPHLVLATVVRGVLERRKLRRREHAVTNDDGTRVGEHGCTTRVGDPVVVLAVRQVRALLVGTTLEVDVSLGLIDVAVDRLVGSVGREDRSGERLADRRRRRGRALFVRRRTRRVRPAHLGPVGPDTGHPLAVLHDVGTRAFLGPDRNGVGGAVRRAVDGPRLAVVGRLGGLHLLVAEDDVREVLATAVAENVAGLDGRVDLVGVLAVERLARARLDDGDDPGLTLGWSRNREGLVLQVVVLDTGRARVLRLPVGRLVLLGIRRVLTDDRTAIVAGGTSLVDTLVLVVVDAVLVGVPLGSGATVAIHVGTSRRVVALVGRVRLTVVVRVRRGLDNRASVVAGGASNIRALVRHVRHTIVVAVGRGLDELTASLGIDVGASRRTEALVGVILDAVVVAVADVAERLGHRSVAIRRREGDRTGVRHRRLDRRHLVRDDQEPRAQEEPEVRIRIRLRVGVTLAVSSHLRDDASRLDVGVDNRQATGRLDPNLSGRRKGCRRSWHAPTDREKHREHRQDGVHAAALHATARRHHVLSPFLFSSESHSRHASKANSR